MKHSMLLLLFITLFALTSCSKGVNSPQGFSLPKGDVIAGKAVFLKYQCLACHSLANIKQPDVKKQLVENIRLGGEFTRVKTYAELVTSVINPSHRIARGYPISIVKKDGKSAMKVYNDVMTVAEMINLIAFLQPHYKVVSPRYSHYRKYP